MNASSEVVLFLLPGMQDPKYSDLIEFFGTVTHSGLSLYQVSVQASGMAKVSDGLFWKGSVDEILRQAMSGGRDWHVFLQALETMEGQAWGLWLGGTASDLSFRLVSLQNLKNGIRRVLAMTFTFSYFAASGHPAGFAWARAALPLPASTAATASQQPTAHSQQLTHTAAPEGARGESTFWIWSGLGCFGACACACAYAGGGGGWRGWFLGGVKARPIDIISSSLGRRSKSTVQTSKPPPNPTSLDAPAKPTDFIPFTVSTQGLVIYLFVLHLGSSFCDCILDARLGLRILSRIVASRIFSWVS